MKPKIRPIRDLYFRFIKGTELDGVCNAQELAMLMYDEKLIVLLPDKSAPGISHYTDRPPLLTRDSGHGYTEPDRDGALEKWRTDVEAFINGLCETHSVCPDCNMEVDHVGEDGIDVCRECGRVVEGSTVTMTNFEIERGDS